MDVIEHANAQEERWMSLLYERIKSIPELVGVNDCLSFDISSLNPNPAEMDLMRIMVQQLLYVHVNTLPLSMSALYKRRVDQLTALKAFLREKHTVQTDDEAQEDIAQDPFIGGFDIQEQDDANDCENFPYEKATSCLKLPAVLPRQEPWILPPTPTKQLVDENACLSYALSAIAITRNLAWRDVIAIAGLMRMSFNAANPDLLHTRPFSVDSNLSRLKNSINNGIDIPIQNYRQCPNQYCKRLYIDTMDISTCTYCTEPLLSSSGYTLETFSYIPLAATLQLLLRDPIFEDAVRNTPSPSPGPINC
jgi:hypothetical protein